VHQVGFHYTDPLLICQSTNSAKDPALAQMVGRKHFTAQISV